MKNSQKSENSDLKKYSKECIMNVEEYVKENNISLEGLNSEEIENRIRKYGYNEIKQGKQKKWYNYFLQSLFTPFNSILLGIALILSYTDVAIAEKPSYANIIVIVILVLVSTLLEFFEEYRSNKSAEKLKELVATTRDSYKRRKKGKNTTKRHYSSEI